MEGRKIGDRKIGREEMGGRFDRGAISDYGSATMEWWLGSAIDSFGGPAGVA